MKPDVENPEAFGQDRLGELIAKYLDRALDDGEWAELDRALGADAVAARRFATATRFEQQLRQLARTMGNAESVKHMSMSERIAAYVSPSERALPVVPPAAARPMPVGRRPRRAAFWLAATAAAAALVVAAVFANAPKPARDDGAVVHAPAPAPAAASVATVAFLGARVHGAPVPRLIRPGSPAVPLGIGQHLLAGDRIDSGGVVGSPAETCVGLSLSLGARLDLAPGTVCDLDEVARISVSTGRIHASVDKDHAATTSPRLTIATPAADVRITGTRFELIADAERTRLRMEDGTVEVSNAAGARPVSTLQECIVAKGRAPSEPTAIARSDLWLGQRSDAAGSGVIWDCGFAGGGGTWIVAAGSIANAPDGVMSLASDVMASGDAAGRDSTSAVAAKSSQPWLFITPDGFVLRVLARSESAGDLSVRMEANGEGWTANVRDAGTENGWIRLDLRAADFHSASGATMPRGASVSAIHIDGHGLGKVWVESLRLATGAETPAR